MLPLRVALKGFMTYREEQVLDFSQSSLWILAGPNGAGKSAIFDAITFALYGEHRAGAQNARDLINHHCDALAVEFDFQVDGQVYRVRRSVSRRGAPTRLVCRLVPANGADPAHAYPIPGTDSHDGFKQWVDQTIGVDYDAFTSSILLLQGQSDKLLTATAADRYAILTKLIDLAPYQALHRAADDKRRSLDGQTRSLRTALARLPAISDAALTEAQATRDRAATDYHAAQHCVERLTLTLEQARHYARITADLAQRQADLNAAQTLLSQADRIVQGYSRWQELDRVLPNLRQLITQRARLAEQADHQQRLADDLVQRAADRQRAEAAVGEAGDAQAALEQQRASVQTEADQVAARLAELGPLVARLVDIAQVESEQADLVARLARLPADLASQVQRAEDRDDALAALECALPWLEQWAASWTTWRQARRAHAQALAEQEQLAAQREVLQAQRTALAGQVEAARLQATQLRLTVEHAEEQYQEAVQRRERFAHVSELGRCEWCGQALTEAHIEVERGRLDRRLAEAQVALKARQQAEAQAQQALAGHVERLQALEAACVAHAATQQATQRQGELAAQEIQAHTRQMHIAHSHLPPTYQARVPRDPASESGDDGVAVYPGQADLAVLRAELGQRLAHTAHLKTLRTQLDQYNRLTGQHAGLAQRLAQLRAALPPDAPTLIHAAHAQAQQQHAMLRERLGALHQAVQAARARTQQTQRAAEEAARHYHACATQLAQVEATRTEMERGRQMLLDQLPPTWRDAAPTLEPASLTRLEQEEQALADYPRQVQALEGARQSLARLEQDIAQLQAQLETIPTEARRPVAVLEPVLKQARERQQAADTQRQAAHADCVRLEQQRAQRDDVAQQLQAAERSHQFHSRLAELLGPRNLQLHLMRQAERTIVDLANDTLNGLSRGTMRLELRHDDDAQSNHALDLVVFNTATGTRPTAVALASGSQRFRIAVSLALAIGRYAGQEARRIESVIIDEGFGSLDKYGRDDMVRELDQLQQRLARIILVSHQDEFANAFSNGYNIELLDGASQVRPRQPW